MKVTIDLPPSISTHNRNKIQTICSSVISGWSNLPKEMQKHVEWVGISPEFGHGNTSVKIKMSKIFGDCECTFFVDDFFTEDQNNLNKIAEKFKEEVLGIVNTSISELITKTKKLEDLIG